MGNHKIYDEVFAHRGFHLKYPENTLASFKQAIKQKFSIEVDVRQLKCGTIICFHDRYMKRLLSVPGNITKKRYTQVKNYKVLGSKYTIPTFDKVLKLVNGRVSILIEVKGTMTKGYESELKKLLEGYKGQIYFHTKNIITYYMCRKIWGNDVFYVLNPFRRRFEFVKGCHYKKIYSVPTIDDIVVEVEDNSATVIRKIWETFNKYTTRVKDDHFLLSYNGKKYQIQHRGIINSNLKENSIESFLECIKFDKVIELDVIEYNNNLKCYHNDSITEFLGQKSSIAQKCDLERSITFEETIQLVDCKVPLVIDLKPPQLLPFKFIDKIMVILKNYNGEYVIQSFNPIVNIYLMKKYPFVIRGQLGHSLNGIKKMRSVLLAVVNFCLFYIGKPDYVVYDLDPSVFLLSKFNNILGLPVIGYTASSIKEIQQYDRFFDNIIVEGDF